MGKKKERQQAIEEARLQRKADKEMKMKMRKKMAKGDSFKLSHDYLDYYANFNKEILPLRLRLKDVAGDGNCLFRAFADQVDGSENSHVFMREEACRFMKDNQEFFQPFLDEDEDGTFDNYLKAMRKGGEWGGHLELQALSECFRCIVVVHKKQLEEFNVRPITQEPREIIHLGYFQHDDFEHYVSIRDIADNSDNPAMLALANLNKNMYSFLLHDDPEEFLLRQQLEELEIVEKGEQMYEQAEEEEPFPNYPRNKRCKCGSKADYKNCCFKEWQKRREKNMRY